MSEKPTPEIRKHKYILILKIIGIGTAPLLLTACTGTIKMFGGG